MTTEKFVLAIDQGTTSTRAIIFNHAGEIVSVGQKEFTQIFPNPGWVEHNPIEILGHHSYRRRGGCCRRRKSTVTSWPPWALLTSARPPSCGIRTPASPCTTRSSGRTCAPLTSSRSLRATRARTSFRQICGLGLSPYFSGSKIKWILDNVEGARERAEAGDLLFGNTDCWVLWNLTGGVNGGVHCTDVTNASRTMLMDIRTLSWREDDLRDLRHPDVDAPRDQVLLRDLRLRPQERSARRYPDRRYPRRPAGGHLRSGLLREGHGEEHLRYGLLHAHEHRHRARLLRQRPAHHGVPTRSAISRPCTPSKVRSPSPARWSSGCATTWA